MGKLEAVRRPDVVLLYDTLVAEHLRREARRKDTMRYRELHASMLDDPFCPGCALAALVHPPSYVYSVSKLLHFLDGTARHEKWQRLFREIGIAHAVERPFFLEGFICTPDAILEIGGKMYVWECKTMNERRWKEVVRKGPPDAFVNRLHVYFAATKITRGILHVENKSTDEYVAFEVRADRARVREMLQRARVLKEAYARWKEKKVLPACTCSNVSG